MSASAYPAELAIRPTDRPVSGTIAPPGSKSITNRALVLAALSSVRYPVTLDGALDSEDTRVMVAALRTLGYDVEPDWNLPRPTIRVRRGKKPVVPAERGDLFVANSGTTMRFLTAMVALGHGTYRLDGIPRMRERPIRDLLEALDQLGVVAMSEAGDGCPPVSIRGGTWRGGRALRGWMGSFWATALSARPRFQSGRAGLTASSSWPGSRAKWTCQPMGLMRSSCPAATRACSPSRPPRSAQ